MYPASLNLHVINASLQNSSINIVKKARSRMNASLTSQQKKILKMNCSLISLVNNLIINKWTEKSQRVQYEGAIINSIWILGGLIKFAIVCFCFMISHFFLNFYLNLPYIQTQLGHCFEIWFYTFKVFGFKDALEESEMYKAELNLIFFKFIFSKMFFLIFTKTILSTVLQKIASVDIIG